MNVVLLEQIEELRRRLDDGWEKIEDAKKGGQDATAWEEFWIKLLAEYEELSDRAWGQR